MIRILGNILASQTFDAPSTLPNIIKHNMAINYSHLLLFVQYLTYITIMIIIILYAADVLTA
jgi:hypothetical protein